MLVPVLGIMAVLQLAWPERSDLPPGGAVARIGTAALPEAPPPVLAPPPAARDLFAPSARRPGAEPNDPLAGAVIAGVVQQGRRRLGVVRQASGQLRYLGVGGTIAGWRLAALDAGAARLTRGGGQKLNVTYGMHAALPVTTVANQTLGDPQTSESGQ